MADNTKDKEMAARLKRMGDERTTQRCPICYRVIPNGTFRPSAVDQHILTCPGPPHKVATARRLGQARHA